MSTSRIVQIFMRGLGLAAGLVGSSVYIIPAVANRSPAAGLVIGIVVGSVAMAAYWIIAAARNSIDPGS